LQTFNELIYLFFPLSFFFFVPCHSFSEAINKLSKKKYLPVTPYWGKIFIKPR
jgi:hypothetical protein